MRLGDAAFFFIINSYWDINFGTDLHQERTNEDRIYAPESQQNSDYC